jgi:phosphopantothenoylcysteine decarboxylase/phosphopantothenate--cysteine ligase
MAEPPEKHLSGPFSGKTFLITAGPTYEPIDPVRFIGNHSTGLMGYLIAAEAVRQGANVILVSGPSHLKPARGLHLEKVQTSAQMYEACRKFIKQADVAIFAAAVADYTVKNPAKSKIKKGSGPLMLELVPGPDIAAEMGKLKTDSQYFVGFALETDQEEDNARSKLLRKNFNCIVLNSLNDPGAGFKSPTNKITIIDRKGDVIKFPLKRKFQVAKDILKHVLSGL